MKFYVKKTFVFSLCLLILLCLTSCYHIDSNQRSEYFVFKEKMNKSNDIIYSLLPSLESEDYIEDIYMFYSDYDLLDSFYTVYLKCKFDEKEYKDEQKRITSVFNEEEFLVKDSDSFKYPSLMYDSLFWSNEKQVDMMRYNYALFVEDTYSIIYVAIFDKETNGKSVNVPEEYLPKELVDIRRQE